MTTKVVLDLVGLDGNAFALMGAYKRAARRQGIDNEHVAKVISECMSGNYDHLLATLLDNTISPEPKEEHDYSI